MRSIDPASLALVGLLAIPPVAVYVWILGISVAAIALVNVVLIVASLYIAVSEPPFVGGHAG